MFLDALCLTISFVFFFKRRISTGVLINDIKSMSSHEQQKKSYRVQSREKEMSPRADPGFFLGGVHL